MALTIVLDTSPLSTVTKRQGVAEADACRRWVVDCRRAGHQVLAPGIARLDAFCAVPGCYVSFTDAALRLAVKLRAQARNAGTPPADPKELDCDVLIASQALNLGAPRATLILATMNPGHLAQFLPVDLWTNIVP